jgi:sortase A
VSQKLLIKICAVIMAMSGVVVLFSTLYPILSYEWESAQKYPVLISPLVDTQTAAFKFSGRDYTRVSNWFDDLKLNEFVSDSIFYFTITIPKLTIEGAAVAIGGDDLAESLIQYPGTAPPGKVGNTVIFGHSVLPAFFDPEDYLSIFSTLPTLEEGDEVYIDYDGITYKYEVEDMFEVKPSDIQILEQNSSRSYLTLVTCTPPGHPLKPKRLIVRAKLIPTTQASGITQ